MDSTWAEDITISRALLSIPVFACCGSWCPIARVLTIMERGLIMLIMLIMGRGLIMLTMGRGLKMLIMGRGQP